MKKRNIIIVSVLLFALLIGCVIFFIIRGNKSPSDKIDIASIREMSIGTDVPSLLYADSDKAVITGTCGVLVYSINEKRISAVISHDAISEMHIEWLNAKLSPDGKYIYLGNLSMYAATQTFSHCYNIETKELNKLDRQPEEFYTISVFKPSPGYGNIYDEYFDASYLTGSNYAETQSGFYYVRSGSDGKIGSLQLVFHSFSEADTVYDVCA